MNSSSAMMTLKEAQAWIPGSRLVGDGSLRPQRVHTDTRTLAAGDCFVALKGERFDGAAFLDQARAQGAVAALCNFESEAALRASGLAGLLVPDTRVALGQLAQAWRAQFDLPLIAVTGSNGKTTVTQMIASILRAWVGDAALATQGNLNNEIGVPLTLLRLREGHRVAVVELGMNHPGEIAQLAAWAQPTVALVNNAQREHLEFMETVEAVARENGSVIESLPPDGVAVFPADDPYTPLWSRMAGARSTWRFTDQSEPAGGSNRVRAEADWIEAEGAWQLSLETPAGRVQTRLRIAGRHNLRNAAAAAACALAAGAPLEAVAAGLEHFEPVRGRSRALALRLGGVPVTLVDDSYNANPDSVRAAIDVLAALPAPRFLILGDMGEVGQRGVEFHEEVLRLAVERGLERIWVVGPLSAAAARAVAGVEAYPSVEALLDALGPALAAARSVLVKGSRFMRMERVVAAIESRSDRSGSEGGRHVA